MGKNRKIKKKRKFTKRKKLKMSIFHRFSRVISNYQQIMGQLFRDPRSPEFALIGGAQIKLPNSLVENDSMERAILWNTPKHRKTLEKRDRAKYGGKHWGSMKLMLKNQRIRMDNRTGEFFELGRLAPDSYKKAMEETRKIKDKVSEAFENGLKPRNQEVRVLYKNETDEEAEKNGKRIIEMEKERPAFFSPNLMQKARTSSDSAKSTTVRPTGLG